MSPLIPCDADSLSTSYELMDESLTYSGMIREASMSVDKNGDDYLAFNFEIIEPLEWAGKRVSDNYIRIPHMITPDMGAAQRRQAKDDGVKLGRFVKAFNPPRPLSTETVIGAIGNFTIRNEEYPEGSGDMRPRVAQYVI